jgi:hypothetical protein
MPITSTQFSVGTVAIQIVPPLSQSQHIMVHDHEHDQSNEVFIGGPNVTTSNGMHIDITTTTPITLGPNDELWAVADGGTNSIHVFRILQD